MNFSSFLKFLIILVVCLLNPFISSSQMSYQEFHERYTPTNETIVPNADVVKSVNGMSVEKAASQIKNSVNSAYDGDEDDKLLVIAVLTSCKRSHIAKILAEMDPYDAVRALDLLKSSWVKELVYFVDIQTYHEIAPDLFLKLYLLNPRGPFGPIVPKWSPAYAGVFYDMSYSGMKGYNNVIDGYGDNQTVTGLKGFGLVAGIFTGNKEGKNRFIDITYQNRTGKTKYETTAFRNSKVNSNTLAINFLKGSDGPKFMWAHGWGIQANMWSYKFQDVAGKYNKLGRGINGGLNYNFQIFINPIQSIPVMLGIKAYAQINLPSIDFNKLSDTLLNTTNLQNDDYKSSIATYGIQIEALYKFGKDYVKPEYKDFDTELAENYDKHLNTSYSELTPRISADGKTLYFVRENHPLNHGGATNSQDIWISDVSNGISNATALHLEKPFNQNNYNSIIGISPDGTSMMIKGRYDSDGKYLGLGFSILQKTNNGWSKPKAQDVKSYEDMAKGTYVGAHWSTDGKHIVISLSEDSENDNQNLYVSHLQDDGSWSKPKLLGNTLNTDGDENGPFLASDGKTLYFSTDREGGEGSNDIWMSQRQDDSWKNGLTQLI